MIILVVVIECVEEASRVVLCVKEGFSEHCIDSDQIAPKGAVYWGFAVFVCLVSQSVCFI